MTNLDIRLYAAGKGIRQWEVARKYGVSETYFCRLMRNELSSDEKKKVIALIDEIAAEKRNAACSATNTTNG